MSDQPTQQPLDLREQLTRIDRAIADAEKLREETRKFTAEQHKLMSEAAKYDRERGHLLQIIAGTVTATATLIAAVAAAVKIFG